MSEIKSDIKEFIRLDDEMSGLSKHLRDLRKLRNTVEERIKDHMLTNNISNFDTSSGDLKLSKIKPKKSVTRKTIIDILTLSLNEKEADKIINNIYCEDEDIDEVTKLERKIKPKSKKN
jgi:seryl-tRNA synthetase